MHARNVLHGSRPCWSPALPVQVGGVHIKNPKNKQMNHTENRSRGVVASAPLAHKFQARPVADSGWLTVFSNIFDILSAHFGSGAYSDWYDTWLNQPSQISVMFGALAKTSRQFHLPPSLADQVWGGHTTDRTVWFAPGGQCSMNHRLHHLEGTRGFAVVAQFRHRMGFRSLSHRLHEVEAGLQDQMDKHTPHTSTDFHTPCVGRAELQIGPTIRGRCFRLRYAQPCRGRQANWADAVWITGHRMLVTLQDTHSGEGFKEPCDCWSCKHPGGWLNYYRAPWNKPHNEYACMWYPWPHQWAQQGVLFADVDTATGAVHNLNMPLLEKMRWNSSGITCQHRPLLEKETV